MHHNATEVKRGITLLEVLISIGILAVGLVGTLALIPAGGTYLQKSQTESRAAALIPNAFSTMEACGLFGQNAIHWLEESETIWEQEPSRQGYPRYPRDVTETTVEGAVIQAFHPTRDDPPWISGKVPDGSAGNVTVTAEGPGGVTKTFVATPEEDGTWRHAVTSHEFSLSDPRLDSEERMTITNSGPSPDAIDVYYDEWSFTVDKGSITVTPPATPARETGADSVTAYRHYRERRSRGYTYGDALLDFTQPANGGYWANDTQEDAQLFEVPRGYDRVTRIIRGGVWRYETGFRLGRYVNTKRYQNVILDGPVQPESSQWYWSDDQGTTWTNPDGSVKMPNESDGIAGGVLDYYRFNAFAGQEFEIDWSGTKPAYLQQSLSDGSPADAFLVEDQQGILNGEAITTTKFRYVARVGGPIYVSAELLPQDDVGGLYSSARLNNFGNGTPAQYVFTVTLFGNHQFAMIDPLMASYLRSITGENSGHPLHKRIRLAAEFPQTIDGGGTVPFLVQRLNWNIVADLANAADAIAVAETLCRPADLLEVDDAGGDELSAPSQRFEVGELSSCHSAPVYDRYTGGWAYCRECRLQTLINAIPLKRECDDRMSWMLTIQPEDGGSIQSNWQAGNYFDVAIAVFQDRLLPSAGDTVLDGEYAFDSWWNDATGLISIPISRSSGVDQDDIRRMFTAGNWILIAPKAASGNQRFDWIQIRTCEFTRESGRTVAQILPAQEPNTGTPKGTARLEFDEPPNLVTLVYQGVVAVSKRSVQITE